MKKFAVFFLIALFILPYITTSSKSKYNYGLKEMTFAEAKSYLSQYGEYERIIEQIETYNISDNQKVFVIDGLKGGIWFTKGNGIGFPLLIHFVLLPGKTKIFTWYYKNDTAISYIFLFGLPTALYTFRGPHLGVLLVTFPSIYKAPIIPFKTVFGLGLFKTGIIIPLPGGSINVTMKNC